ncbi:hypothetical protein DEO72_LG5g2009 [Vigna unguiculata]|uniref:Uncharacterized protein n=1 Tax=Vigna unguiculata TaxID=3917 RepID=A0A4D6LYG9_VIGUN|nr:hypothetical protein DEO72_LG5g2009 [Vigna unguiculata]
MNLPTHINHAFQHQSRTYTLVTMSRISWSKSNISNTQSTNKIRTLPSKLLPHAARRNPNADRLAETSRHQVLGSYEEPPGGKQRATKRQILNPPSFWVFGMNDLAVMNTHQATRVQ